MIKVRGFQVAPAEIEAVLHGHPAVKDCAVFGVPDGVDGESVVAAVATRTLPVEAPPSSTARVDEQAGVLQTPEPGRLRDRNSAPALRQGAAPSSQGALWMYV